MKFKSLEEGIIFYQNYAKMCGFSTRRTCVKRRKSDSVITSKYCVCNREGIKKSPKDGVICKRKRAITRFGCLARVKFNLTKEGEYMVFAFHEGHTHVLSTPTTMHHVKQSRNMTILHKKYIVDNGRANVGAVKSFRTYKELVGGYGNVGASMVDFKKFQRDIRKHIRSHDAQMLVVSFKRKKEVNSSFFYEYDVDDKNRLTRIFWADPISRKNYSVFGDVVSFDTTYSMNEYSMVFAPFTGIDNHHGCVTFAAGLISKEDVESFEWLFNSFRNAMRNCDPVCLITDQDLAMKIAIEKVFDKTKTRHRLCMWHIMKKLTEKVGSTVGQDEEFLSAFCSCVWSKQLEPEEFDDLWNSILEEYELSDNEWLNHMFEIRKEWIPAYYRDEPMPGIMRTTSRSESENNFFNHFTTPHLTLFEFWMRYQSAMDAQRYKQSKLIHDSKTSMPQRKTPLDLEIHASKEYTHSAFYAFQEELIFACFHCGIQSMTTRQSIENIYITDQKRNNKFYSVKFNKVDRSADCSCKMLIREGIPCRHILWVLKEKGIKFLPEGCINSRWTKVAMNIPIYDLGGNLIEDASRIDDENKKVGELWSEIFSCVTLAEQSEEYMDDLIERMKSFKEEMISKGNLDKSVDKTKEIETLLNCPVPTEVNILNPNVSNNKGSRKRTKGQKEVVMEKSQKPLRVCKTCNIPSNHDSRNCPQKKK